MAFFQRTANRITLIGLLVLGFILPIGIATQAQSNSLPIDQLLPTLWTPPVDTGDLPGNREGGGVRGCSIKLTALAPNPQDGAMVTATKHPSFFWYISQIDSEDDWKIRFELEEIGQKEQPEVFSTEYKLAKDHHGNDLSGVMRLDLPVDAAITPLEGDQSYRWSIVPICNGEPLPAAYGSLTVSTMSEQLQGQLEQATFQQKVAIYARNGLWPETLSTLYDLSRFSPDNPQLNPQLQQAWLKLLNSVGLEKVAQELSLIYAQSPVTGSN